MGNLNIYCLTERKTVKKQENVKYDRRDNSNDDDDDDVVSSNKKRNCISYSLTNQTKKSAAVLS